MQHHNQHIDQYFREQLGGYTEMPAPDVWASLEQRLDEKPRKRRALWIWFAILLMAAIGGVAYYTCVPGNEEVASAGKENTIAAVKTIATNANIPVNTFTNSRVPELKQPEPQEQLSGGNRTAPAITKPDPGARQPITVAESVTEPNVISNTTAQRITKAEPLEPVEPLKTEIKKPETEPDILNLLPTAGLNVPVAKMEEEEFQALIPVSGNNQMNSIAIVDSPIWAAESISPPVNSEIVAKAQPAMLPESQPIKSVNVSADALDAANNRIRRFSAGIKNGYEFGTKPYHANSFVVSPYVQYNFSKRFGLMLQPAFKFSHSKAAVLSYGSYTQTTDSLKEMLPPIAPNAGTGSQTGNDEYMAYQKTYDSIFIRNELKDIRYWNLDLPLMLSYKVHKNFSVYAGPAFHFTKVPKVVTTKQTYSGLVLNDTKRMERKPMSAEFDTLDIKEVFPQTGFDISQYNGSAFDNPMINPFKMGVSFGLSYTFRQRFHFDILYRQTLSKMEYIHNEKVREILKQPYIRVTLGFDLLK